MSEIAQADAIADEAAKQLRVRFPDAGSPRRRRIGTELVGIGQQIGVSYEVRDDQPAWSQDAGPGLRVVGLIAAIRQVDLEGLYRGHQQNQKYLPDPPL